MICVMTAGVGPATIRGQQPNVSVCASRDPAMVHVDDPAYLAMFFSLNDLRTVQVNLFRKRGRFAARLDLPFPDNSVFVGRWTPLGDATVTIKEVSRRVLKAEAVYPGSPIVCTLDLTGENLWARTVTGRFITSVGHRPTTIASSWRRTFSDSNIYCSRQRSRGTAPGP